jgi:putative hydrolase of HD superfamily
MKDNSILNFIFEAGLLKLVKRSGWWVVGIKNPESVADHSFRCAVIGYFLAREEKADAEKVLMMTLFGDIHEARINDSHKMAQMYFNHRASEDKAFAGQIKKLPKDIKKEFADFRKEYLAQKTKEGIIARDADILECLLQAKEYTGQGYAQAIKFSRKPSAFLKTASAKKIWSLAKKGSKKSWWEKLSKFER